MSSNHKYPTTYILSFFFVWTQWVVPSIHPNSSLHLPSHPLPPPRSLQVSGRRREPLSPLAGAGNDDIGTTALHQCCCWNDHQILYKCPNIIKYPLAGAGNHDIGTTAGMTSAIKFCPNITKYPAISVKYCTTIAIKYCHPSTILLYWHGTINTVFHTTP